MNVKLKLSGKVRRKFKSNGNVDMKKMNKISWVKRKTNERVLKHIKNKKKDIMRHILKKEN